MTSLDFLIVSTRKFEKKLDYYFIVLGIKIKKQILKYTRTDVKRFVILHSQTINMAIVERSSPLLFMTLYTILE